MKFFLLLVLVFTSISSHAQLFGPTNYEDCVIKNIKESMTDFAIKTVQQTCWDKFKTIDSKGSGSINECYVTWTGDKFVAGSPRNTEQFIKIQFSKTTNQIYMPAHMDRGVMREKITQDIVKIQSICPGINID